MFAIAIKNFRLKMIEYLFSLELKNKTEKAFSLQGGDELLMVTLVL